MSRLARLLYPKSIAVFGGLQASRVVEQCRRMGFVGEIWPVHPSRKRIENLAVYPSVEALPGSPDAAFIGVNRFLTIEIVQSLRSIKTGGAVCYASGFGESGVQGRALQAALVQAAGEMPIIGPNCYGMINYLDGSLLWPDQHGGKRLKKGSNGVAIITQSSNIAINLSMQCRGLPLAWLMTVGNQAQVGLSELALEIIENPRVSALGLHIEGFDSTLAMEKLARRARELRKPVLVLKVGKSEYSRSATLSHTASMAGARAVSDAFLQRNGFGQAHSIPVFLETLKLLHCCGPLSGYRLSSMSCSGGEASIIADNAVGKKVYFPALTSSHQDAVGATLGPMVTVSNPLDYHTYCWGKAEEMTAIYSAMLAIGFDMNLLVLDFPGRVGCDDGEWVRAARCFQTALQQNKACGAIVASMPENIPADYAEKFLENNLLTLLGFEEALMACEIAADIQQQWSAKTPDPILQLNNPDADKITVNEALAKKSLARYHVPVPPGHRAQSVEQAVEQAGKIGFPVALKALGFAHKTEKNAVRLNLNCAKEVARAAHDILLLTNEIYVEAMIDSVVAELVVGIVRESPMGLVMRIGSGGVFVEILDDQITLLIPTDRAAIEQALLGLKSAPVLSGYRGKPKADFNAAVDAIVAIQEFAIANARQLLELEVNPLIIRAQDGGATAVDALMVMQENSNHD